MTTVNIREEPLFPSSYLIIAALLYEIHEECERGGEPVAKLLIIGGYPGLAKSYRFKEETLRAVIQRLVDPRLLKSIMPLLRKTRFYSLQKLGERALEEFERERPALAVFDEADVIFFRRERPRLGRESRAEWLLSFLDAPTHCSLIVLITNSIIDIDEAIYQRAYITKIEDEPAPHTVRVSIYDFLLWEAGLPEEECFRISGLATKILLSLLKIHGYSPNLRAIYNGLKNTLQGGLGSQQTLTYYLAVSLAEELEAYIGRGGSVLPYLKVALALESKRGENYFSELWQALHRIDKNFIESILASKEEYLGIIREFEEKPQELARKVLAIYTALGARVNSEHVTRKRVEDWSEKTRRALGRANYYMYVRQLDLMRRFLQRLLDSA
jgi:hypothetical protein